MYCEFGLDSHRHARGSERSVLLLRGMEGLSRWGPFTVDGIARIASSVVKSDWSRSLESHEAAAGDAADAAVIARGWLEDAFAEHGIDFRIFARFTLDLLALGAPSELVLAAQRAGLDEVRHARLCFALAARHSGESRGAGGARNAKCPRCARSRQFRRPHGA